jgi:hypothetical protein
MRSVERRIWRRKFGHGTLLVSVVVALITALSGTAVAATALTPPPGSGRGARLEGTTAAKSKSGTRATVKHAAAAALPDATGALSTVSSVTVNGGYTAAGIGMRNLGYGTISITGVPAGATVKSATLLWDVLGDSADPTFAQGTFDGTAITGTEWASGASPCWPVSSNFSYEADVTSLVTGNGSYNLTGFASGESDGADPWNVGSTPPLLEGASLVVVYTLASMPQTSIQIGEGATETDSGNTATATLDGFTAAASPAATTTYIVADGQYGTSAATFNGTTLPGVTFPGADPQAVPNYSLGNLWDTTTADVGSLVNPGDTSATLSVTGSNDCLVWVGQVLSVGNPTSSSPVYAALGDSFSSGEGNPPFIPDSNYAGDRCHRSLAAYSEHLSTIPAPQQFEFVACSGATTADITGPNTANNEPAQTSALSDATTVVTLTIGGDDLGFSHILKECIFSPISCKTLYSKSLPAAIKALQPTLLSTYEAIHAAAPNAFLAVGGYPDLFATNPVHNCHGVTGISTTERAWLDSMGDLLNSIIQAAVTQDQAVGDRTLFVPVNGSVPGTFTGHQLCSPSSTIYINQENLRHPVYSFHPDAAGQLAYAAAFDSVLKSAGL